MDRLFGKRRGVAYSLQVIAPPDFHVQAEVDGRAEIEVFNALRNAISPFAPPQVALLPVSSSKLSLSPLSRNLRGNLVPVPVDLRIGMACFSCMA